MAGRYDDLSQEMWGNADRNMPADYLKSVMAQINAIQPARKPVHNPDNFWERVKIVDYAKEYGTLHPREGQPTEENPFIFKMTEWYKEGLRRADEIPYFPYRLA